MTFRGIGLTATILAAALAGLITASPAEAGSVSIGSATAGHNIYGYTTVTGSGTATKNASDLTFDWIHLIIDGAEQSSSFGFSSTSDPNVRNWSAYYAMGSHQPGNHAVGAKLQLTATGYVNYWVTTPTTVNVNCN